ncbi:MAG: transcriptional repressor NrdR [Betaproteobacteria bacterium]|nr:transcriptional repressor NrdR [Betaproteobacteria bacterium]
MKCPFCSAQETQVIDSRVSEEGDQVRRRRRCTVCHKRFTTYENAELRMPTIVKGNGQREDFLRKKLETSFHRALHKRPVGEEAVAAAIDRIEQSLLNEAKRELPSRKIGEMVMQELKQMDEVAYVRFASVYRSFSDAEDFKQAIKEVSQ